jgi:type IV/VI secretion system ImpK/VasF family protein
LKLTDVTKELFDYLIAFRRKVSQASAPNLEVVRHDLELLFYTMDEKIAGNPKLSAEYQQVKYPLAVLADEVVLTSAWSHAKRWEQCLLEKKYFSSNIGGNQFFRLLTKIDQMSSGVITVFFYCLALGFRGGFAPNDPSLLRLKGRLFTRIMPSSRDGDEVMFADTYRMDKSGSGKLPRLWKWRHLIIGAVIVFISLLFIQRVVVWPLIMGTSINNLSASGGDTDINVDIAAASTAAAAAQAGSSTMGYTVQLGSFTSETVAVHFAQQIEQKGIKSKILSRTGLDKKQQFIVLSGQFTNREDAEQALLKAESASSLVSEMSVIRIEEAVGDCIFGCN